MRTLINLAAAVMVGTAVVLLVGGLLGLPVVGLLAGCSVVAVMVTRHARLTAGAED